VESKASPSYGTLNLEQKNRSFLSGFFVLPEKEN